MHGVALAHQECVQTLLNHYDRQIANGLPRERAIAATAEHYGVEPFKVEFFADERRTAVAEFFSILPAPVDGVANAA